MLDALRDALQRRFIAWALRVRPPEAAPIVLTQRRVYVLPTRAGLAFAAALGLMFLGSVNYNLGLGYVLTFLLAGLGVAAILSTFRNLAGLRISPGRCDPVFAGASASFPIIVENPRPAPRWSILINMPAQAPQAFDVPAGAAAAPTLTLAAPARGWLTVPRLTIASTFPLGLVRAWSYCAPDQRCLVYPTPAPDAPPLPVAGGAGEGSSRGGAGRDDFAGLRQHQPADSPRHVAWKAAARGIGPLLTKQFAGETAQNLVLAWDALPALGTERRLSILTRWVLLAHDGGHAWSLRLPGLELPLASGEAHYRACLQALALHGR